MTPAKVVAQQLECPTCWASPGQRCHTYKGSPATSSHPRRHKAARERNAELFPVHVRGQLDLWGTEVSA